MNKKIRKVFEGKILRKEVEQACKETARQTAKQIFDEINE